MIDHITNVMEDINEREERRPISDSNRSLGDSISKNIKGEYCIAMENYFTLPKIMPVLRAKGIGVFGTSRFKKTGHLII